MLGKKKLKDILDNVIDIYFDNEKPAFIPGKSKVSLMEPSYGKEEVKEVLDSLLTTYVTMGKKVNQFEKMFADYMQIKHAIMVNSGSSADFLSLYALTMPDMHPYGPIKKGDEIITSPLTWSTAVSSIVNIGAVPVFVDVNVDTYNINADKIEEAITDKTKAIMPVHLLGNPCEIDKIAEIAKENKLYLIEDTCESYGAEFNGKKVGSFGDLATTSFFFSHHITTIEGGMILTNNDSLNDIIKSLRAHGWIREMSNKDSILKEYPLLDPRFFFYTPGFNMRPTELQGAFGIHQLPKLEGFIEKRRQNAKYLNDNLEKFTEYLRLPREAENTRHIYFCYPIAVSREAPFKKKELVDYLESRNIETRPIETGNIINHPVADRFKYRVVGDLYGANYIDDNSFFIGNHHGLGKQHLDYIIDTFDSFIRSKVKR